MRIGKKNIIVVLIILIILYGGIIFYGEQYLGKYAYFILYIVLGLSLYIGFEYRTKLQRSEFFKETNKKYQQLEILTSLYNYLDIDKPLPETGGWAASPDLLKKITEVIFLKKPNVVVEASSGVSSIVIGYCCKKIGNGKVISLEHDYYYYERTKNLVAKHGLEDYVNIVYAPLKEYTINNKKWLWYDIEVLNVESTIDMIVVDGPPFYIQDCSRYPVVPLMYDKMSNDSVLLLDDGIRDEEKKIISMWNKEFNNLSTEFFNFEEGAFVVSKVVKDNSDTALLAFTTANQIEYNIKGLKSLLQNKPDNVEVVVYDDASADGTVEWCRDNNIPIITKEYAKGLTHSWNLAYQKFKEQNYKYLIYANSDIVVPKNSLELMLKENDHFAIVSPLSTLKGVGHQPLQDVRLYHKLEMDEYDFENTQHIQDYINAHPSDTSNLQVDYINGYFFSVNRDVIKYEYNETQLFDPETVNVGNEEELCRKVNEPIGVALNSYIFHFKGVSMEVTNMDNQSYDLNIYRNLNWQQAEKLKSNPIKKFWFKVKYKLNK